MTDSANCNHPDLFFGSGGFFIWCAKCKAEWTATNEGKFDHSRPNTLVDSAAHRILPVPATDDQSGSPVWPDNHASNDLDIEPIPGVMG